MNTPRPLILIIDDDSRNIFALRLVLQSRGFQCVTAGDAEEGLSLLEREPGIQLVLLDMMMPVKDGYETLETIRASEKLRSLPVIAVTAQAMQGDREKCLQAGATDYLSKPVNVDQLALVLEKYITSKA